MAEPFIVHGDLTTQHTAAFRSAGEVAVDTETSGLSWQTDRLQLVQVSAPMIGTVLIHSPTQPMPNLASLLSDATVSKVFHFAPFDLRFLQQGVGAPIRNVRCTKTASKLLSPTAPKEGHSLAALMDRELGVNLQKGAIRVSNWGATELSTEQVAYATGDVERLVELHQQLREQVAACGLTCIYDAVCRYLPIDAELEIRGFPNPLAY